MPSAPNIGKKRVIARAKGKAVPARRSRKARSLASGTMQMKARRETILGEESLGVTERMCPTCFAVYFDKHWHAAPFFGGKASVRKAALKTMECDACMLSSSKNVGTAYLGEVIVSGTFGTEELAEIARLVRNVGKRATKRDPEDRVIAIDTTREGLRIRTTENQLAVSIGKQVHRARKDTTLTITWSHGDKPVRVRVER